LRQPRLEITGALWLRSGFCRRDAAQAMRVGEQNRSVALSLLVEAGILLAGLALAASVAAGPHSQTQAASNESGGVTHLRVTDQVILPGVTRLGINLGEQTYYDSGQMVRNLLYRNPGFEGMAYRSILHCLSSGPSSCTDTHHAFTWPAGFWDGARFEVLDGTAVGRKGGVKASGPSGGGYGLTLDAGGPAIGAGDWLAVSKEFPGDPAAGWWPKTEGGARLEAERKDLSPETEGRQALRIEANGPGQSVELKSYFDSTEGFTFVRMRGRYRLSFRAKALAGSRTLHAHVKRIVNGKADYLEQDFQLTPSWADYHAEFAANEGAGPVGPVEAGFSVTGGSLLLDDVDLEQTGGDATNRTAFRDEVLQTLRELRPGVLRLMSSHAQLGSTVDNLLAAPMARQRPGFSTWQTTMEDIPIGIPEFLELCREVGAEPWIVAPTAMSADEARELAEYLAGGVGTPGGALRAAQGQREPWTRTFKTIHIELGNETWNGIFQGESMDDPAAYGRRADTIFHVLRGAAGADVGQFDLVVGSQAANPWRSGEVLRTAHTANSLAIAPYLMDSVTHWSNDDELYGPLMAQPEQMSRNGIVQATQAAAGGRQLAIYEVNLHTTEGSATQDVLDRLTPSAAAGVAIAGHMLRMMRDHGVRDEMLFSLPQFRFRRADGTPVRLWGSVVQMGAEGRARPQLLAEALANRVIHGNMVKVEVSGENPTHDQPEGNDGVRLNGVHEIDAYAFQDGKTHGLIVFNYGLHQARRINLEAAGLNANSAAKVWRLVSSGPGSSNEQEVQVSVKEERLSGTELDMAPCSMAAVEWSE
jgi:alpha-L-arabinofuranosidase